MALAEALTWFNQAAEGRGRPFSVDSWLAEPQPGRWITYCGALVPLPDP
ncbi:hypothetical protein FHX44_113512 [Pseudonocardia hierapolitana]|uniref:Uncharacterized protein n=1 Tax=Pseudonocardia hierapolitana TaxID=1128676 RepID=A0A561SRV5_9PSEU|nr:hypothetical protein FHX44_113512 [Pseudonocardia hierapolitana]